MIVTRCMKHVPGAMAAAVLAGLPASAAEQDVLREEVIVSPRDAGRFEMRESRGNVDNLDPKPESLIRASTADMLVAQIDGPAEYTGKRVVFTVHSTIEEEHKEDCTTVISHQPYSKPGDAKTSLSVASQIQVHLVLEDSEGGIEEIPLQSGRPHRVRVGRPVQASIKITCSPDDAVFDAREPSQSEIDQYVMPRVRDLQNRPNHKNVHYQAKVYPGDVSTLRVKLSVERHG